MKNIILSTFLIIGFALSAQESKIDSLKKQTVSTTGLELVNICNDLSWEYKNSNLDSAKLYGFKARYAYANNLI